MKRDKILILDFGGTQGQALARKVRGNQIFCEVLPFHASLNQIRSRAPKGIILAGGFNGAHGGQQQCDAGVYDLGIPVLAMGSPARNMVRQLGGSVLGDAIEKSIAPLQLNVESELFEGLEDSERFFECLAAVELPQGFEPNAMSDERIVGFVDRDRRLYGVQFEVERNDPDGYHLLSNFSRNICGCEAWWSMDAFVEQQLEQIREQIGQGTAMLAVSGGVDSTVCAALMHKAIGDRLHCIMVDNGMMRSGEVEMTCQTFSDMGISLQLVEASDRFFEVLEGVEDADEKRRLVGATFGRVFEEQAERMGGVDFLVRGIIYSDLIENPDIDDVSFGDSTQACRSGQVLDPISQLFKDEVREMGELLGLPKHVTTRQSFPGAGYAVRCLGLVTRDRVQALRAADSIYCDEIVEAGMDKRMWQYFAVLTSEKSIGIRDGVRRSEGVVALRAINSADGLNAGAVRLPYDLLERVAQRIISEVTGINRVVYDITAKPPAGLEWQ